MQMDGGGRGGGGRFRVARQEAADMLGHLGGLCNQEEVGRGELDVGLVF